MGPYQVGIPIEFEMEIKDNGVVVPISGGTFTFKDPAGVLIDKAGTLVTDGSDGKLKFDATYNTDPLLGTLTIAGNWKLQVLVDTTAGGPWESSIIEFRVEANL
ncbi:hypothetical protein IH992_15010 [Candidatus Poribacteria bacterium]|nr:hypothetical protein [Candidatus Poribacteria bacterium]